MNITEQGLREQILKMASLVEACLEHGLKQDVKIAEVFELEDQINRFHMNIDDSVFKYLALKTPHARDLRQALAIMKINSELERMGDQAVSIKRYSSKFQREHPLLSTMSDEVRIQVKNSIDSFVTGDTALASDVIKSDREINALNREILRTYMNDIKNDKTSFDEGFNVIRVAKSLERIGDHSTNVAEDVIFLVSGRDIRHNPEIKGKRPEPGSE